MEEGHWVEKVGIRGGLGDGYLVLAVSCCSLLPVHHEAR